MRVMGIFAAAALVALSTGCATMVRGTEQQVFIDTTPQGATIEVADGPTCTSPCTLKVPRNKSLHFVAKKPGCETQAASMLPRIAGSGVLLGGVIDYANGAVYDLKPNPLTVTLNCTAAQS